MSFWAHRIQLPKRMGAPVSQGELVQLIDIAPTMLELAGVPIPEAIQGRSLTPLLEGKSTADWRDSVYYHYYEYSDFHTVRPHYGVRTDRYKLVRFYGDVDAWEFYDLKTDPTEIHNRIDDPAVREHVALLKAELSRLRAQYRDNTGPPVVLAANGS